LVLTRIYVKSLLQLFEHVPVHALAHITGGGITENLPRVLPDNLQADIDLSAWEWPAIFDWLQSQGQITDEEMLKTFNCGIGMIICVAPEVQNAAIRYLENAGETVVPIGQISPLSGNQQVNYKTELEF